MPDTRQLQALALACAPLPVRCACVHDADVLFFTLGTGEDGVEQGAAHARATEATAEGIAPAFVTAPETPPPPSPPPSPPPGGVVIDGEDDEDDEDEDETPKAKAPAPTPSSAASFPLPPSDAPATKPSAEAAPPPPPPPPDPPPGGGFKLLPVTGVPAAGSAPPPSGPSRAQKRLDELQGQAAQSVLRGVQAHTSAAGEQLDAACRAAGAAGVAMQQGTAHMHDAALQICRLAEALRGMKRGTCLDALPQPKFSIAADSPGM